MSSEPCKHTHTHSHTHTHTRHPSHLEVVMSRADVVLVQLHVVLRVGLVVMMVVVVVVGGALVSAHHHHRGRGLQRGIVAVRHDGRERWVLL